MIKINLLPTKRKPPKKMTELQQQSILRGGQGDRLLAALRDQVKFMEDGVKEAQERIRGLEKESGQKQG